MNPNRRAFLADVGNGMLVASIGPALARDLGFSSAAADDRAERLTFGALEPWVSLMQETPADKLLPVLVGKLKGGTSLRTLVAAAALANARTFGGNDYVGFHTLMALPPALDMAQALPETIRPLPVLKVIHRNAQRIQEFGGSSKEVLHLVEPESLSPGAPGGEILRQATRQADDRQAERVFAAIARGPAGEAFNHLQFAVQDEVDVHRVVLAWRAWVCLDLTGREHAHTLLRQSVRYCVAIEQNLRKNNRPGSAIRTVLPKLLDQYRLVGRPLGTRRADDGWIVETARVVYGPDRERAADTIAAALADGISPESVGEAISVAANLLVLHDPGRPEKWATANKPAGSVHGDSIGVHASDAANAWRNIARVGDQRNTVASLIVAAFHTAGQSDTMNPDPFPLPEHLDRVTNTEPERLLREAEGAIRTKDQLRAAAIVHRYGELGHPARPVFDLLLRYGISEDGALHAEKYYRTVTEEYQSTRPALRFRQVVALTRVTASEYGWPAPGYAEARQLLGV
jgi:hypothetical protein